jgi:transcriptional regulator with XRE-family HTH domain
VNTEILRQIRRSQKISQEEMARSLNISLRAYQLKEKAENEFLFSEIVKIADKLGLELNNFINRIV